jgi:hypothetical protein
VNRLSVLKSRHREADHGPSRSFMKRIDGPCRNLDQGGGAVLRHEAQLRVKLCANRPRVDLGCLVRLAIDEMDNSFTTGAELAA